MATVFSLGRYALESVLRHKQKSLFAVIGTVLAVSLVSGSLIAADSSALGLLRASLKDMKVDFVAREKLSVSNLSDSYFQERIDAIDSVEGVDAALPVLWQEGWHYANRTGSEFNNLISSGSVMFLSPGSDRLQRVFGLNGSLPVSNTAAIPAQVAEYLNISVGDNITLFMYREDSYYDILNDTWIVTNISYVNFTFPVSVVWTQDRGEGYLWVTNEQGGEYGPVDKDAVAILGRANPIFLLMADSTSIISAPRDFSPGFSEPNVDYYIWIDRQGVINVADISGSLARLEHISESIETNCQAFGIGLLNPNQLADKLVSFRPRLEGMKILFIVVSLPVVGLGTYLSMVGVDLSVTERRREVGVLKSRGASNKDVLLMLTTEAASLGAIGGVIGLLIGLFISRFLLDVMVAFSVAGNVESAWRDFSVAPATLGIAVALGVLMMFVSSLGPFRRIAKVEIAEALHYYSQSASSLSYKPRTDILMLLLSGWCIVSVWAGSGLYAGRGWSWITESLLAIVVFTGTAIFPVMPFMLSLSSIRLLTRGTGQLYAKFSVLVKTWTKSFHDIVDKNIRRNPRRASSTCLIVSLAIAISLFISITLGSSVSYERDVVRYEVGADIRIRAIPQWPYNFSVVDNLGQVGDVKAVSECQEFMLTVDTPKYKSYPVSVDIFDPEKFARVVQPDNSYFLDPESAEIVALGVNGTAFIESDVANAYQIAVGDYVPANFTVYEYVNGSFVTHVWHFSFKIIGMVKGMPGLTDGQLFMDRNSLSFLPLHNFSVPMYSLTVFVDLQDSSDASQVVDEVQDILAGGGFSIHEYQVLGDELEKLNKEPTFRALSDFLYAEYFLSIAITSIGVGLVTFITVSDRERELACIMARGASRSQMRKILMGESLTLLLLGLTIGVLVGLITAFVFNSLAATTAHRVVERSMVVSDTSILVIGITTFSLLVASLAVTNRAGRMNLSKVLRIRGG